MYIRRIGIALFFCFSWSLQTWAQTDSIAPELNDSLLIVHLRNNYTASSPKDYDEARDSMYTSIDVDETDSLTCVYSGLRAKADGTRTPENGGLEFNTEHSWPQSFYNNNEPMRGDIHHLFPTWSSPNQSRGNHPFAEIDDNLTTSWWYWENGSSVSSIPSSDIDSYSEYYSDTFEPREDHKGNAARAMFYFWAIYQTNSDIINDEFDNEAYFNSMKDVLYEWHKQDPVDANEVSRSLEIESVQGNRNPFIHDTTLVRRAFFYKETESDETSNSEIIISEVYEANGGTVKYIELFNRTDSTINLSSGDWAILRYSNSSTSPSSISLSGSINAESFFVVGDDNSSSGIQTIFGEGFVDLNSSAINHNGNDSYVLVKNASATPDTVDSFAKDNIGNSSTFAANQVAYRIFSELPNDGSFGQTSTSNNGDTVTSGNWVVFDISSNNSNAKFVGSPGYSKGIESSKKAETAITGSAQWRLISIPVEDPTISQISDDTAIQGIDDESSPNVFTFNQSGTYSAPATSSTVLNEGEGLAVFFYDNTENGSSELPLVLDVNSDPPSTDVSVNLNTTTEESGSYFTLVGNPFQTNFDADELSSDNPIQANIHFLENGLYQAESVSNSILLPWQGFWVESGTSSAATTITFPVSGKTNSAATQSYFSKESSKFLTLEFGLQSDKTFDKGCRIDLNPAADPGWDRFDATKLKPARSDYGILSCESDSNLKSVESLPYDIQETTTIDFVIESVNVSDSLELTWNISESVFENYTLLLFDSESNIEIPLSSEGKLDFIQVSVQKNKLNTNHSASDGSLSQTASGLNRFSLTIIPKNLSTDTESDENKPSDFILHQNYPNPFNPSTQISFELPKASSVEVKVFDAKGSLIQTLVNERLNSGSHFYTFNADGLASGIYFYTISSEFGTLSKRMILAK